MEKTLLHKDHPVYYRIYGKGNAVMLIHGFAEDGQIWKYQEDALKDDYLLIIPDLPGSGNSQERGNMTIEEMAETVKAILDAEKIDSVTLVGHSMGGYITLAFAEKYPDLLRSFCLFHSTAYADTNEKKETRRKSIGFILKQGSYEFIKQSTPNMFGSSFKSSNPDQVNQLIEQYRNFNPHALVAYYEAMILRPDRTSVLKTFKKPILFIMGRHDNAIPLKDGLAQCHLPIFSYIHILDESGHMGLWEEAPESNRILADFLAGQ